MKLFINGFAACHNLPSKWFESKAASTVETGGNTYQWKQGE